MIQLILHLIGDYVTQSDWMAQNKTKRFVPAAVHAIVYSLPFILVFQPSYWAGFTILVSHLLIDRYRLARYVVYAKNVILQPRPKRPCYGLILAAANGNPCSQEDIRKHDAHHAKWAWANCSATGYPSETPAWLSVWLLIIADNTLHLAINYSALKWL